MKHCEQPAVTMHVRSSHATLRSLPPLLSVTPTAETSVPDDSADPLRLDMPGPSAADFLAGVSLSASLH